MIVGDESGVGFNGVEVGLGATVGCSVFAGVCVFVGGVVTSTVGVGVFVGSGTEHDL